MTVLNVDNDQAFENEETEECASCGNEFDPSDLNDCPYCGDALCDDCLAEHEDDEGEHGSEDEDDDEMAQRLGAIDIEESLDSDTSH